MRCQIVIKLTNVKEVSPPGCGQHAVSGQGVRFDSLDILMTFLGRVLNTGDTTFLEEVRRDSEA